MRFATVSLLVAATILPLHSGAADRAALVIGIDQYENLPASAQLRVAARDAQLLGKTLSELPEPFAVTLLTDADREEVSRGLDEFIGNAKDALCALVFFAGHGIEYHGENYLLVRDTKISAKPDEGVRRVKDRLYYESISLHKIMEDLSETGANLKIVILDACRDNPLELEGPGGTRSVMGSQGGLVRVTAPTGMLVSYSADEGQQANDGLFTAILAKQIQTPGSTLMEVFARTRSEVREQATILQAEGRGVIHEPAEYSKLDPSALRFTFVPGDGSEPWQPPSPAKRAGEIGNRPQQPAMPTAPASRSTYEVEKLLETKAKLAEIESRMESEKKRYQDSLNIINKLTNNKRTPVVQGSAAYHQCLAASNVIKEIEDKAPEMKAEKARLEAILKALEGEPSGSQ